MLEVSEEQIEEILTEINTLMSTPGNSLGDLFCAKWEVFGVEKIPRSKEIIIKNLKEDNPFWGIKGKSGIIYVLPSSRSLKAVAVLISDDGRPAERLYKDIFDISSSGTYNVEKMTTCQLIGQNKAEITSLGRIVMPR